MSGNSAQRMNRWTGDDDARPLCARSLRLRAGHIEYHHCQGLVSRIRESMGAPRHVADHVAGPDLERLAVEQHSPSPGDDDVNLLVVLRVYERPRSCPAESQ